MKFLDDLFGLSNVIVTAPGGEVESLTFRREQGEAIAVHWANTLIIPDQDKNLETSRFSITGLELVIKSYKLSLF